MAVEGPTYVHCDVCPDSTRAIDDAVGWLARTGPRDLRGETSVKKARRLRSECEATTRPSSPRGG